MGSPFAPANPDKIVFLSSFCFSRSECSSSTDLVSRSGTGPGWLFETSSAFPVIVGSPRLPADIERSELDRLTFFDNPQRLLGKRLDLVFLRRCVACQPKGFSVFKEGSLCLFTKTGALRFRVGKSKSSLRRLRVFWRVGMELERIALSHDIL